MTDSVNSSADNLPRPNILLITLDQFRAECLSAAGHPNVQTPNLDRLAEQGLRFANHYSNCAPCAPGRASLLTGLWQMNHRVTNNGAPLADNLPMLPRELRRAGYDPTLFGYTDTALDPATLESDDPRRCSYEQPMDGFSVGVLLDDNIDPWIDWLADQGFAVPDENRKIYDPAEVPIPEGRGATWAPSTYSAEQTESAFLTEAALNWISSPDRGTQPWCAHLSYLRPHPPYLAPSPYNDMFDPADMPQVVRHPSMQQEAEQHPFLAAALTIVPSPAEEVDQRQLQATYFGMIAEVDHQVGVLLDGLDQLGLSWRDLLEPVVAAGLEPVITAGAGGEIDRTVLSSLLPLEKVVKRLAAMKNPATRGPAVRNLLGDLGIQWLEELSRGLAAPLDPNQEVLRAASLKRIGVTPADLASQPLPALANVIHSLDAIGRKGVSQSDSRQAVAAAVFGPAARRLESLAEEIATARTLVVLNGLQLDRKKVEAGGPRAAFDAVRIEVAAEPDQAKRALLLQGLFGPQGPALYAAATAVHEGIDHAWVFRYENNAGEP